VSTITVAKKDGWAAIAADTLTWSRMKNSAEHIVNHQKIFQVEESYLAVCGPAAASLVLHDYFQNPGSARHLNSVSGIFRTWLSLHRVLKEEYFLRPEEDHDDPYEYESSNMGVLIANPDGIFGVYSDRWVEEYTRFHARGSGDEYALGAMHAVHAEPGWSAERIARLGVEVAAEYDDATALPVLSYTVRLKGE
jgi:ATP-dependent HslUV protease, peptidase subunit HslV